MADNAMRIVAALAYYTVFSLAPLMLAAIGIAGRVFGYEATAGKIYAELTSGAGLRVAAADNSGSGGHALKETKSS